MRLALLALVSTSLFASVAQAEPCGRPDVIDTSPPDEATGVPTNASLHAHYELSAEYLGEDVTFQRVGDDKVKVTATFNENEGIVSIEPPVPLEPNADYIVEWPQLRGFGTATRGDGAVAEFRTGSAEDEEPPRFGGLVDIRWDVDRERDECTDSLTDRFVFELDLDDASDDGGRESLTLVVFQTSGTGVGGSPEPVLVRSIPKDGKPVRVRRVVDDADGDVCFAAIARDLVGNASSSGSVEVCTTTTAPPFFYGCRITPALAPRAHVAWTSILLAAVWLARRRRR